MAGTGWFVVGVLALLYSAMEVMQCKSRLPPPAPIQHRLNSNARRLAPTTSTNLTPPTEQLASTQRNARRLLRQPYPACPPTLTLQSQQLGKGDG